MTARLDLKAVAGWMARNVPGFEGPLAAEKFETGQSNPTFLLTAPSGRYVLRRKPPGTLLKSAHAVDREFRVQKALAGTDVPVARMHALCEDDAVIGTAFYVMEHVEGRNFWDPRLPDLPPEERAAIFDEMNRVLAAIHWVDLTATGLSDFGPEGDYYARQIARWTKQYRASETETVEAMEDLIVGTVRKTARQNVMSVYKDRFEVVAAKLGDDAGVLGAAACARQELANES
jgi:aminoglycoside phosphotransferase (APT) family kinase protein